jgi:hypothetical protein
MANVKSLSLGGTAIYVTAAAWKPTSFSISCWIKPTGYQTSPAAAKLIWSSDNGDVRFDVNGDDNDGRLHLGIFNGTVYNGGQSMFPSVGTIPLNDYSLVGATYNGATKAWAIYIGTTATPEASGTGTAALSYTAANNNTAIGARNDGAAPFQGLVDDFRLYDTALSGADLINNAQQELVGTEANLYDYYKFEDNLTSSAGTPHNGTAVGGVAYSTDIPTWVVPTVGGHTLTLNSKMW